jgi:hypothetical protein
MFLHHISTISLITAYVLANMHVLGAAVAVMHDSADIFACLARVFQPTKLFKIALFSFAAMMIIWFYTRLILLPYIVWILIFKTLPAL